MGSTRDDVGSASFERDPKAETLRPLGAFNAADAKNLVQGYKRAQDGVALEILSTILRTIEKLAKDGKEVTTYGPYPEHHEMVAANLIERGFKAKVVSDQRDGGYIDIRW